MGDLGRLAQHNRSRTIFFRRHLHRLGNRVFLQTVADYLEVGGEVFWSDDDFITTSGLGAFAEYNFDLGTEVVPFVGASIDYANAEIDEFDSDENAIVLGVRGGVKCFIAENIAISGQAVIEQATEDIYAEQDGVSDNDFRLELGMRFFIGP